jgi:hypothetical protein
MFVPLINILTDIDINDWDLDWHWHHIPFLMLMFSILQDVVSLTSFFQNTFGISVKEKQLSVSGRNWGEVDLNGQ